MVESVKGSSFYVDFERIQKHDEFIYFWYIRDYLNPETNGDLSSKEYRQGDCKLFRYKILSSSFHKEPMGGGTGRTKPVPKKHKDWKYLPPNTPIETLLKISCSR